MLIDDPFKHECTGMKIVAADCGELRNQVQFVDLTGLDSLSVIFFHLLISYDITTLEKRL